MNPANPTRIHCNEVFSLAGAAILRSGLSHDSTLLGEPCVVLRPIYSLEEATMRIAEYQARGKEKKAARMLKGGGNA